MKTKEVMSTHVHKIDFNDTCAAAAVEMRNADVGCLVVTSNHSVRGVITDRDIVVRCLSEGHDSRNCPVSHHMTSPAVVTSMDTDMLETAHLMKEKHITRIPVVENDHVIGLVSLSDIAYAVDQAKAGMDIVLHDLLVGMGANRSA